jgi:hypothetical protein
MTINQIIEADYIMTTYESIYENLLKAAKEVIALDKPGVDRVGLADAIAVFVKELDFGGTRH